MREPLYRADAGLTIVMTHTGINCGSKTMPKIIQETDEQRRQRVGLSSLRLADDESKAVQKTKNRVSLDDMLARIRDEEYYYPALMPHLTICILMLDNGYALVGKSVPADPENYDVDLGRKFAKEDAIRQMWPLEAYLLRERMML